MRRFVFLTPLALSLIIGAFAVWGLLNDRDPSEVPSALINRSVPNFYLLPLPGLNSPGLSKKELLNLEKVSVVNFFASWCLPCRAEHQSFIKLSRNDDIELVGINYKDNDKDAHDWLNELGNPYTYVGNDFSGRTGIDWGITGVPETFIVNKNGKVVHRFSGPLVGERFEEFKELLMLELK